MAKKILLSQELGNNILTRKTISAFFERINSQKEAEIVLDFKGVDFISRSCADEYLKQKEESNKKIIERNMSKEVYSMFKAVRNQYEKHGLDVSFINCSDNNQKEVLV